ncbi:hypothetical protein DFH08DRAFT_799853 [Mycena albidolilacea]|uniref:Uncharacterized protein n=1 Tax=Mycena albidolilacea TaxID=1033008 RepID=A0AAD7AMF8_9AGAR|nr:hypothetical protein DFH08DRAFT_799853 [Mycena albidolilacea]
MQHSSQRIFSAPQLLVMAKGTKKKKKPIELECPTFHQIFHTGTAGEANLENHKPACKGPPKGVHGYKVPLDLEMEKDLEVLCEGLKSGKAHLAGEATVAAFRKAAEELDP